MQRQLASLALVFGAAAFSTGCVYYEPVPVAVGPPDVVVAQAPPRTVVVPRGQWKRMKYRYFPDQQVYYNIDMGRWYWLDGGRWADATRLPDPIRLNLTASVIVDLDGDRPREFHNHVVEMYPPHRPGAYPPGRPPYPGSRGNGRGDGPGR